MSEASLANLHPFRKGEERARVMGARGGRATKKTKVSELLREQVEARAEEILRPYFDALATQALEEWSPSTKLEFFLNQTLVAEKVSAPASSASCSPTPSRPTSCRSRSARRSGRRTGSLTLERGARLLSRSARSARPHDWREPNRRAVEEYERVRRVPTRFLVLPGEAHVFGEIERVVQEHDGYVVVEKFSDAGRMATKLDPRSGQK